MTLHPKCPCQETKAIDLKYSLILPFSLINVPARKEFRALDLIVEWQLPGALHLLADQIRNWVLPHFQKIVQDKNSLLIFSIKIRIMLS